MSRSKRNAKADEYFRRAPNYSAEAIRDLNILIDSCRGVGEMEAADWLYGLGIVIECAHKFALPDGGRLFTHTSAEMVNGFRLPFDQCVFEFASEMGRTISVASTGHGDDDGIVQVWTLLKPRSERWFPLPFFLKIAPSELGAWEENGRLKTSGIGFWASKRILEWGGVGDASSTDLAAMCDHDTWQSRIAVTQACAALSCTNVTTELIRPNREARAARPESTLFDYHVLMIRPGAERHASDPLGGSHASPRTHLRRGHIRQHQTAGRIWVNSCVVNPTAIGTVNKDYRIVV